MCLKSNKDNTKLRVTTFLEGISTGYRRMSFIKASNMESVSMFLRHHDDQYHSKWTYHLFILRYLSFTTKYPSIGIHIIKIRRSHDRLIFIMELSIPGKTVFIYRHGPGFLVTDPLCTDHLSAQWVSKANGSTMLLDDRMTSWHGNAFIISILLIQRSTVDSPHKGANDVELWYLLYGFSWLS